MTSKTLFFSEITKEINITGDMLDAFSDLFRLQQYQEKEHFILVEEEKNAAFLPFREVFINSLTFSVKTKK